MQLRQPVRITGEDRIQLRRQIAGRYRRGATIRQLSESLGRSYGFVHRLLSESDEVELRKRGGNTRMERRR